MCTSWFVPPLFVANCASNLRNAPFPNAPLLQISESELLLGVLQRGLLCVFLISQVLFGPSGKARPEKADFQQGRPPRKTHLLHPICDSPVAHFGHPQTCVYPDVCLGIAHVSGKVLLPGQGVR